MLSQPAAQQSRTVFTQFADGGRPVEQSVEHELARCIERAPRCPHCGGVTGLPAWAATRLAVRYGRVFYVVTCGCR